MASWAEPSKIGWNTTTLSANFSIFRISQSNEICYSEDVEFESSRGEESINVTSYNGFIDGDEY